MSGGMTSSRSPRDAESAAPDAAVAETTHALPAWMAFVVQFNRTPAGSARVFSGRIEHLNSGCRVRFVSRDDLVVALDRLLDGIEPAGGGEK